MTNEFYEKILELIRPNQRYNEELLEATSRLRARTDSAFSDDQDYVGLIYIGSSATGTSLIFKSDIDGVILVARYNRKGFRERVQRIGLERPKFKDESKIEDKLDGFFGGFEVNFGCVDIRNKPENNIGADIARHPAFSRNHLNADQRDQVRLAKIFFKSAGISGGKIGGFAIEQLIAHFGNFDCLLKEVAGGRPVYVDFSGRYSGVGSQFVVSYPYCGLENLARLNESDISRLRKYAGRIIQEPTFFFEEAVKMVDAVRAKNETR